MTAVAQARFATNRLMRRLLGPVFGMACLLATCTGVAVLALLLGSIVVAALQGPPEQPWYAIGSNVTEVGNLLRRLATSSQSRVPVLAGYRVGIAGSLWLLGLVAVIGIPVGVGAGVYLEEYARPGRLRPRTLPRLPLLASGP